MNTKLFTQTLTHVAAAALLSLSTFLASPVLLSSCSSDEDEETPAVEEPKQEAGETVVCTEPGIPIRITTVYGAGTNMAAARPVPFEAALQGGDRAGTEGVADGSGVSPSRVRYDEAATGVATTWEAGDQIYVVCGGKISLLSLESGAGTKTATFSGELAGFPEVPAEGTAIVCWVKEAGNDTYSLGASGTFSDKRDFTAQDGTLQTACKYIVYRGEAAYTSSSDIVVNFKVHDTCIMKFGITASNGVQAATDATLRYNDDPGQASPLAMASFKTDASMANTVYMAVPSGVYGNAAYLGYTNETLQGGNHIYWNGVESVTLPDDCQFREIALGSNNSVTLKPGKMYSKSGLEPPYALTDFIYEDGTWGEPQNHPNGKQGIARVVKLGAFEDCDDYERGYTHGYAFALEALGPTVWQTNEKTEVYCPETVYIGEDKNFDIVYYKNRCSGLSQTDYLCTLGDGYGDAAKLARSYDRFDLPSSKYSSWFLPTTMLYGCTNRYLAFHFSDITCPIPPTRAYINFEVYAYKFWTIEETDGFSGFDVLISYEFYHYYPGLELDFTAIGVEKSSNQFLVLPFIAF